MIKPTKYANDELNIYYITYLEDKLKAVKSVVNLTESLIADQSNGLTDGSVCVSAMKDIRRHIMDVL